MIRPFSGELFVGEIGETGDEVLSWDASSVSVQVGVGAEERSVEDV